MSKCTSVTTLTLWPAFWHCQGNIATVDDNRKPGPIKTDSSCTHSKCLHTALPVWRILPLGGRQNASFPSTESRGCSRGMHPFIQACFGLARLSWFRDNEARRKCSQHQLHVGKIPIIAHFCGLITMSAHD